MMMTLIYLLMARTRVRREKGGQREEGLAALLAKLDVLGNPRPGAPVT
jgi:hypothetical protein